DGGTRRSAFHTIVFGAATQRKRRAEQGGNEQDSNRHGFFSLIGKKTAQAPFGFHGPSRYVGGSAVMGLLLHTARFRASRATGRTCSMDEVRDSFRSSLGGWLWGTAAGLGTVLLAIAGIALTIAVAG